MTHPVPHDSHPRDSVSCLTLTTHPVHRWTQIGEGGFGAVYHGKFHGTDVAIKVGGDLLGQGVGGTSTCWGPHPDPSPHPDPITHPDPSPDPCPDPSPAPDPDPSLTPAGTSHQPP